MTQAEAKKHFETAAKGLPKHKQTVESSMALLSLELLRGEMVRLIAERDAVESVAVVQAPRLRVVKPEGEGEDAH